MMEKIRDWEKGTSNPIPPQKYDKFKEKLAEYSERNKERNIMLFLLGIATGYRSGDLVGLTIGEIKDSLDDENFRIQYILPALVSGMIEMKYPESPKHPEQKYSLTELGKRLKKIL